MSHLSGNSLVKIHELMNILVHLCQRSTNIIKQVQHETSLNIVQKGHCSSDVCTKIDLQIQKTIHTNLTQLFPKARVICEEDQESISQDDSVQINLKPDELLKLNRKHKIMKADSLEHWARVRRQSYLRYMEELLDFNYAFLEAADVKRGFDDVFNNDVTERDLTFWVDPLDGSKGLVEGHVHHLTTIIGICIKNRPLFGVVHKPFGCDPLSYNSGKTFIGLPQSGLFTVLQNLSTDFENFENYTKYVPAFTREEDIDKHLYRPRICGSHNKNQDSMDRLLFGTHPQRIERVAGSANKFVHMIEGHSDFYINLVPGFKYWDMCGSEAILASRFGILTDAHKRPIFYEATKHPTLQNGIIAAKNKRVFEVCERRIERYTNRSLQQNHKLISEEAKQLKRLRDSMSSTQLSPIQEKMIDEAEMELDQLQTVPNIKRKFMRDGTY